MLLVPKEPNVTSGERLLARVKYRQHGAALQGVFVNSLGHYTTPVVLE